MTINRSQLGKTIMHREPKKPIRPKKINDKRRKPSKTKLVGGQVKLDVNKDGKISGKDFRRMKDTYVVTDGKLPPTTQKTPKPTNKDGTAIEFVRRGTPEELAKKRAGRMGGGMLKKAKPMNKGGRAGKMGGGMMKKTKPMNKGGRAK